LNSINDFIKNNVGLQGIKVLSINIDNSTFYIMATSAHDCAVCPNCGHITYDVHDKRWRLYNKHLPIWDDL
jgi:Fe2+ or Zn2+ uptake regulation protein